MIPDRPTNLREIAGINRSDDARITAPGTYHTTMNLYGRLPGLLEERPGSKLLVNGKVPTTGGNGSASVKVNISRDWKVQTIDLGEGERLPEQIPGLLVKKVTSKPSKIAAVVPKLKGIRGIVPDIEDKPSPSYTLPVEAFPIDPNLPELREPVKRVAGLHKVYISDGSEWIIGALNMGSGPDRFFYVKDGEINLSNDVVSMWPFQPGISARGADWFFIDYRSREVTSLGSPSTPRAGFWGLMCNGVDPVLTIKRLNAGVSGEEIAYSVLDVQASSGYDGGSKGRKRLVGPGCMTVYQGSVVYGNYRMRDCDPSTTDDEEVYDHFITFSDVGKAHKLASTDGVISSIRIGDNEEEPVTALAVSTVPTDTQGIKGQLVAFTGRRVTLFDGLPPQSQNPLGVNFASVVIKDIGCNAPRTVVQTPKGVMFLGSNGVVYLINGLSGVVPVGRAVEPILRGMDIRQQRACSAYYDRRDGFYKLSYPSHNYAESGRGSTVLGGVAGKLGPVDKVQFTQLIPDEQLWADVEHMVGQGRDLGVRWFGPMTGQKHSCYFVDRLGECFAGSAIDASLYEVSIPGLFTDPVPEDPTTARNIECVVITGLFDLGDAHVDKTISDCRIGVGASAQVTVTSTISILGSDLGAQSVQTFNNVVDPSGDVLGSTFVLGTSKLVDSDDYRLVNLDPTGRLRGKMFRFMFRVAPAGAKVFFADFQFSFMPHARRK